MGQRRRPACSASMPRRSRLSASSWLASSAALPASALISRHSMPDRHVLEPPGGVQARSDHEAQVVGAGARGIAPGDAAAAPRCRARASRADAAQALRHQPPIVVVQAHDVGDGAERDQVEQLREVGLRARGEGAAARATRRATAAWRRTSRRPRPGACSESRSRAGSDSRCRPRPAAARRAGDDR